MPLNHEPDETEDASHIFFKIRHLFPRMRAVYEAILSGDRYESVRAAAGSAEGTAGLR
jgi:hypothetical protein